jgi:hypothetical protein
MNTPYGESVGKAFALPFQAIGKVARAVVSAPGSGGPFDSQRPAAPGGDKLAALREAEVNRNVQAARANQPAGAPAGGTDFISRIRQAESAGNINAVGRNIPGQGTAKSDMQVMDATNTNPGYGVRPAQNASLEERSRVGRDYAQALLQRYGNEQEAAAAYNWGPGNYDAWKASGANLAKMPAETRAYVAKVTGGAQPQQQTAQAGQPQQPAAQAGGMAPQDVEAIIQEHMTRGKAQLDYLQQMANVTRDPATIQKIRGEYEGIQNAMHEAELYQAAQTGRISPEQYQMLSARAQQASAASQQKRMEEMYKAEGQMRVEGVKGANTMQNTELGGIQAQQLELLKLQSLGYKPHSNAMGKTYWYKGNDIREVAPDGTLTRVQTAAGPQAPSFFDQ